MIYEMMKGSLKVGRGAIHNELTMRSGVILIKEEKGPLMIKTISRDELKKKIDRGDDFQLVETLPKTAFDHAHLPGAINLPPDRVNELAATLLSDKDADIVVYCAKPS